MFLCNGAQDGKTLEILMEFGMSGGKQKQFLLLVKAKIGTIQIIHRKNLLT